jgi:hypothetical protein
MREMCSRLKMLGRVERFSVLCRSRRVSSEEGRLEMLCRSGLEELYRLCRLESSELVGREEGGSWDAPFRRYISI